jgi:hypothetical protein
VLTIKVHDGQVSKPEQKASVKARAFSFTETAAFSMSTSETSQTSIASSVCSILAKSYIASPFPVAGVDLIDGGPSFIPSNMCSGTDFSALPNPARVFAGLWS